MPSSGRNRNRFTSKEVLAKSVVLEPGAGLDHADLVALLGQPQRA